MRNLSGPVDLPDISSRDEIIALVDAFYERVRDDKILGPIFNEVARVDWGQHLPKMYDFWESVLFGAGSFKGNPMKVHVELAQRTAMTDVQFSRWLRLFGETVDELFQGPVADDAKLRASRIAALMQHQIATQAEGLTITRG